MKPLSILLAITVTAPICLSTAHGQRTYADAKCEPFAGEPGEYACAFKTEPYVEMCYKNSDGCYVCEGDD